MKKILFLSAFILGLSAAQAQVTEHRFSKDTAVNSDTVRIDFTPVKSAVSSIQASVKKVSGTVAGKVYLYGTTDGNFILIDSLAVTDQATNTKAFLFDRTKGTQYAGYRVELRTTGGTSTLRATVLRRPDE